MPSPDRPDGCISIDGGPEDKNHTFLKDTRSALKASPRHTRTERAIDNVLKCLGPGQRTVDLVGHGTFGVLRTGCGMTSVSCNSSNNITSHNEQYWGPFIADLQSKATLIRLWGCHVGCNAPGQALVSRIHALTGATVMAPTVLIYWSGNKVREHPGNGPVSWITADDADPNPAIVPLEGGVDRDPVRVIQLPEGLLSINQIEVVAIEYVATPEKATMWLEKDVARNVIASLGISAFQPDPLIGVPGAIVTHWIHVVTSTDTYAFGVFNERYVFPRSAPSAFARVSQQFLALTSL